MGGNRTPVIVWFVRPVRGVDPASLDEFVSDRHEIVAETVRQDREETIFIDSLGEIVGRWPTSLILRIVWPAPSHIGVASEPRRVVTLEERKQKNPSAYDSWTPEEEAKLLHMADADMSVPEMSAALGRSRGAVRSRLRRLGRG